MAFIPDDSYDKRLFDKLLPIVWEFYQYLCRKRNHETRLSDGTIDNFIELYGYKRASKFILIKELKTTQWIGGTDGKFTLLVGDFSPVNKKADERKAQKEQSKNLDFESKKIDSDDPESLKNWTEKSKKLDWHDSCKKGFNSFNQHLNQQDSQDSYESFECENAHDLSPSVLAVVEIFGITPPINSQDAIDASGIADLDLWRKVLTEKKAGIGEGEWNNTNFRQKQIGYCLTNYRNALERKPPKAKSTNGYDPTKDMLSPEYAAPPSRHTFQEIIWLCYDTNKSPPTIENYRTTKKSFLGDKPTTEALAEVEKYERSDEFRERFSQTKPGDISGHPPIGGRREHPPPAHQMPVSQ